MDKFLQDLKFGIRSLKRNPGVTVLAMIALALGIGANTALFSILYSVLWKPLPLKEPEKLVMVWESPAPDSNSLTAQQNREWNVINPANFSDWKEQNKVFVDMAAFGAFAGSLSGDGPPEEVPIQLVTPNFFDVLGVKTFLGRTFSGQDGIGGNRAVILTHGFWMRRYGGNRQVVGQEILINGRTATIVGVLPKDFHWFIKEGSMIRRPAELYAAYPITDQIRSRTTVGRYLSAVARLKPGVSVNEAKANMILIAKQLEKQHYAFNAGWSATVIPLREQLSGQLRKPLWILAGAVGFVLLIACTNVANLMLSRALARSREIAVRAALGAGRLRIIRQMLTESIVLSIVAGIIGVLVASWGVQALAYIGQRAGLNFGSMQLNAPVLLFTIAVSVLTGLVFGIFPALTASRWNLNDQLKEGSRGSAGGHGSLLRNLLVSAQIAIALLLLSGSALLIQSFLRLTAVNPGFDAKNVLTFRVQLPASKYPELSHEVTFFKNAVEQIQAIPGVESAGIVSFLPFAGPATGTNFLIQGRPAPEPGNEPSTLVFQSDNNFFEVLRIPLLRGRLFTHAEQTEAKHVVLINEALAEKYFPNEDPIDRKIRIDLGDEIQPSTIIGVVGNVKHETLTGKPDPSVYWPHSEQLAWFMTFVIRTEKSPMDFASSATAVIRRLDPDQPVADVRKLDEWLGDSTARSQFSAALLGILAAVALALSIAGTYGVMSHAVIQRTQEMGIRMALGASSGDVFKLVLKEGSRFIVAGIVAGSLMTFALTRVMKSMLYETSTTDPITFITATFVLILAALAACSIPSIRASRVNPIVALRYE